MRVLFLTDDLDSDACQGILNKVFERLEHSKVHLLLQTPDRLVARLTFLRVHQVGRLIDPLRRLFVVDLIQAEPEGFPGSGLHLVLHPAPD